MNTERLFEVLTNLRKDLDATDVDQRLSQLDSLLQEMMNQPSVPQFQSELINKVEELRRILNETASHEQGPVWRNSIEELGLSDVLAPSIELTLKSILQRSQLTPAVAIEEVRELRRAVSQAGTRIGQVLEGLSSFGVTEYALPPEKAAISILIPRAAVHNDLDRFGTEARLLSRLLKTIGEVATGTADDIEIQFISTSDLLVCVTVGLGAAKLFASTLSTMIDCYKKLLEVRRISAELKQIGLSEKQLTGPEDFAKETMATCIDDTIKTILKGKSRGEATRQNELRVLLKKALWGLATRLDDGYSFDVQADTGSTDDEGADETTIINELRPGLRFQRVNGAKIVELPRGQNDIDLAPEVSPAADDSDHPAEG